MNEGNGLAYDLSLVIAAVLLAGVAFACLRALLKVERAEAAGHKFRAKSSPAQGFARRGLRHQPRSTTSDGSGGSPRVLAGRPGAPYPRPSDGPRLFDQDA